MYVCTYVYVYVCMYVCMYMRMYCIVYLVYICDLICKNPEQSCIYGYSVSCIFVLYVLQALLSYDMKPVLIIVFLIYSTRKQ